MVNVGKPEQSTEPTLRMSGYPSHVKYNSEITHFVPHVPYFRMPAAAAESTWWPHPHYDQHAVHRKGQITRW
jgi:hypothetical protein